ncbi:MAG: phosphomannomutase/phosphoglucomutase [Clostridioides sp.]|jgi:phosphomannomutase|nr:phosphomannomutase/phosphoglucomutase [Clostridioides sp.]
MLKLQNGSDIRGIAYPNDEKEVNLTLENAEYIFSAFLVWLEDKLKKEPCNMRIALGTDSRITGREFQLLGINIYSSKQVEVMDCKMATTPAMFMTTVMEDYDCDASIMITASHLPYYYNGFKFFTKDGGLNKQDITEILKIAQDLKEKSNKTDENTNKFSGKISEPNLIEDYSNLLLEKIRKNVNSSRNYDKPLENIKILVDAGNGAGGFFADKILQRLGANTSGSQFLNPDGMFPNHVPNPENKTAMKSICDAVVKNGSDLGIIFDTDVDRAALVGKSGKPINKDALIALISSIILSEHPNTTIVTDSITSVGLAKFIEANGGNHHRFKRGYKNVINEAIRLNDEGIESHLAIETSGHAALKENYFLDDGAYLIAKILIEVAKLNEQGKSIESLIEELEQPKEEGEYRIEIAVSDFKNYAEMIINDLKSYVKSKNNWSEVEKNYEGIRVNCMDEKEEGWFLLRVSLHEPLLVLNIASKQENGVKEIYNSLKEFLSTYELKNI